MSETEATGFEAREKVIKEQRAEDEKQEAEGVEGSTGQEEGDEAGQEAGGEGGDDAQKNKAQPRIDELTAQRRKAESQASYWQKIASGGQPTPAEFAAVGETYRVLKDAPKQEPTQAEDEYDGSDPKDPAPGRDKFTDGETGEFDEDAYLEAKLDHRDRMRDRKNAQTAETEKAYAAGKEQEDAGQASYERMAEQGAANFEDWQEVVGRTDLQITADMARALLETSESHEIAYHLGKNPEESARIAGLTPYRQVVEIGKLAVRFEKAGEDEGGDSAGEKEGSEGGEEEPDPVKATGRSTKAPAAPSASPTGEGGGGGKSKPKAGTAASIDAHRSGMKGSGRL